VVLTGRKPLSWEIDCLGSSKSRTVISKIRQERVFPTSPAKVPLSKHTDQVMLAAFHDFWRPLGVITARVQSF